LKPGSNQKGGQQSKSSAMMSPSKIPVYRVRQQQHQQHQLQVQQLQQQPPQDAAISKLRNALEESSVSGFASPPQQQPQATSPSSAKRSDAVIMELRSQVRQLRRQLDKIVEDKSKLEHEHQEAIEQLHLLQSPHTEKDVQLAELQTSVDQLHAQLLTSDMVRRELEDTLEAEQYTWELRTQDQDRAIQLLRDECAVLAEDLNTCRQQWKEAEEAFSRETTDLQQQLDRAQQESAHWRNLSNGSDSADVRELKGRLIELEQERGELQSCLDEALKELEAVDAELQGDTLRKDNERLSRELAALRGSSNGAGNANRAIDITSSQQDDDPTVLESLRHLHRWLLERDGNDSAASVHAAPKDAHGLLNAIQEHLERLPPPGGDNGDATVDELRKQVAELNSQISVYRGDLKAREESSAELRASLKEAVALLKPLQDAVAKADKEKAKLKKELAELKTLRSNRSTGADSTALVKGLKDELAVKQEEIDRLQVEVQQLELELSRARLSAASGLIASHRDLPTGGDEAGGTLVPDSLTRTREELKAKRASEKTLKQLLKDAQSRFQTLHLQNQEIEQMNNELHDRLKDAEDHLDTKPSSESDGLTSVQRQLTSRDTKLQDIEEELHRVKTELASKDAEVQSMTMALENAKSATASRGDEKARLLNAQSQIKEMEAKLAVSRDELLSKKDAEKALKKSLKEALSLLKPLQVHLEEAESEKRELLLELGKLRKRSESGQGTSLDAAAVRELEATVKLLELENAQLHDALEDMSQSINASHVSGATGTSNKNDSRLREEIVQLKSRNEVTQKQLEMAKRDKNALVETLNKREKGDAGASDEVRMLREKLSKAEAELENAKLIATTALVRVEELTALNEPASLGAYDPDSMFREKALHVDREMKAAREHTNLSKAQYRLT
jgi:chromosome segregation ATPase